MVFHWSLSDSKSTQVSRNLLSILAVLNNAVVWMVSTRPPTSKSSSPFNNPLVTIPKAPITIGIIVTFMTASLSMSPGHFLVFSSILTMLRPEWSRFFLSLFSKPLETVLSVLTTTGITVTLILHSFFSSLTRSKYSSIFPFLLFPSAGNKILFYFPQPEINSLFFFFFVNQL